MTDLFKVMAENRLSAINCLKSVKNFVEFDYDENDDNRPYILICDRHGEIYDTAVSKVRLTESNDIEIYVEDWGEWVNDDECLSTTANNVYIALSNYIFG